MVILVCLLVLLLMYYSKSGNFVDFILAMYMHNYTSLRYQPLHRLEISLY